MNFSFSENYHPGANHDSKAFSRLKNSSGLELGDGRAESRGQGANKVTSHCRGEGRGSLSSILHHSSLLARPCVGSRPGPDITSLAFVEMPPLMLPGCYSLYNLLLSSGHQKLIENCVSALTTMLNASGLDLWLVLVSSSFSKCWLCSVKLKM